MSLYLIIKSYSDKKFKTYAKQCAPSTQELSQTLSFIISTKNKQIKQNITSILCTFIKSWAHLLSPSDLTLTLKTIPSNDLNDSKLFYPLLSLPLTEEQISIIDTIPIHISYETWLKISTPQQWHLNHIVFYHNISHSKSPLDALNQFIALINKHNFTLPPECFASLISDLKSPIHLEKIQTSLLSKSWQTPSHLHHCIIQHINNDINLSDISSHLLIPIINLFPNPTITLPTIIRIVQMSYSTYSEYVLNYIFDHPHLINPNPKQHIGIAITDNDIHTIFHIYHSTQDNKIKRLLTEYSYMPLQQHITDLCSTNITDTLFIFILSLNPSLILTSTMFVQTIKQKNLPLIKYFLDQKSIPKEEYIYLLHDGDWDTIEIIKLFLSYGLSLTPALYAHIKFIGINTITAPTIPKSIKDSIICATLDKSDTKNPQLEPETLAYAIKDLYELKQLGIPTTLQLEAALRNDDHEVMLHMFDTYHYVPKLFDIMKIPTLNNRYIALQKMYPSLIQLDDTTTHLEYKIKKVQNMCIDFELSQPTI